MVLTSDGKATFDLAVVNTLDDSSAAKAASRTFSDSARLAFSREQFGFTRSHLQNPASSATLNLINPL